VLFGCACLAAPSILATIALFDKPIMLGYIYEYDSATQVQDSRCAAGLLLSRLSRFGAFST
jgi:hypothetical protein